MAQSKGDASLSRPKKGFTVQASPFNVVKFDLALIVVVGLMLLLVHDRLIDHQLGQVLTLLGYGCLAMCWIVFRTRRVASQLADDDTNTSVGDGK